MSTLGATLKAARERKGLTPSEVAAGTRIKVQHIEAIERDDFSRIAAAAYAKGFIKLYAEYVEVEPEPLIDEYMDQHAPANAVSLPRETKEPPASEAGPEGEGAERSRWWEAWAGIPWRQVLPRVGAILLAALLLYAVVRWVRGLGAPSEPAPANRQPPASGGVIREPPPPYMDVEP